MSAQKRYVEYFKKITGIGDEKDLVDNIVPELHSFQPISEKHKAYFRLLGDNYARSSKMNTAANDASDILDLRIDEYNGPRFDTSLFPHLEEIRFSVPTNTSIIDLDLTPSPLLKIISFGIFNIQKFDFSYFKDLEYLFLYDTSIKKIDLSKNNKLRSISLMGTDISNIDLSKNSNLEKLRFGDINWNELDLTSNLNVNEIRLYRSKINRIKFGKNTNIRGIIISATEIEILDLSDATKLFSILCNKSVAKIETLYLPHEERCAHNIELHNVDIQNIIRV